MPDDTAMVPGSIVIGHAGVREITTTLDQVAGITVLAEPPMRADAAVTVLVTDLLNGTAPPVSWIERLADTDGLTLAVVAAPETATRLDPHTAREVARLRSAVDATVVVAPGYHRNGVRSVVTTLHDLIARSGVINLDPADVRTVLDGSEAATITTGTARATGDVTADTGEAVEQALAVPHIDIDNLSSVLVNVVGGTDLTLASAVDAADGIQRSIPSDAVLIWGVAVDEAVSAVHAQVVASSDHTPTFDRVLTGARQLSATDDCPRCGGTLSVYSFGERETAACDDCGYAGTPTTL